MSPPPHRVNAKVEGRDRPKKKNKTMEAFKTLTKRILKVPMSEVKEQQAIYDARKVSQEVVSKKRKPRSSVTSGANEDTSTRAPIVRQ